MPYIIMVCVAVILYNIFLMIGLHSLHLSIPDATPTLMINHNHTNITHTMTYDNQSSWITSAQHGHNAVLTNTTLVNRFK